MLELQDDQQNMGQPVSISEAVCEISLHNPVISVFEDKDSKKKKRKKS